MAWTQAHDNTMPVPLAPTISVNWRSSRAWHGATVEIQVRTTNVADNALVDVTVHAMGQAVAVDTIAALAITGNAVDHNYVINWKGKALPANVMEFELVATLQDPAVVSARSAPLYVDLAVPVFSA